MLMQNFGVTNKEYYGMLWYFLEWLIQCRIHNLRWGGGGAGVVGGGHPDPEIRGGNFFFSARRASVRSEYKGGGPPPFPFPGSTTAIIKG